MPKMENAGIVRTKFVQVCHLNRTDEKAPMLQRGCNEKRWILRREVRKECRSTSDTCWHVGNMTEESTCQLHGDCELSPFSSSNGLHFGSGVMC
nr:hypothetical protein Itr_chr02CG23560 [Ipomoea trifida]